MISVEYDKHFYGDHLCFAKYSREQVHDLFKYLGLYVSKRVKYIYIFFSSCSVTGDFVYAIYSQSGYSLELIFDCVYPYQIPFLYNFITSSPCIDKNLIM